MTQVADQDTIMLRLAELTRPCTACYGTGVATGLSDFEEDKEVVTHSFCGMCHGDKVVPLLDPALVRVDCMEWSKEEGKHLFDPCKTCGFKECHCPCPTCGEYRGEPAIWGCCQERGWTSSQDPWAYVRAAWKPLFQLTHSRRWNAEVSCAIDDALDADVDPGLAALAVVAEALLRRDAK